MPSIKSGGFGVTFKGATVTTQNVSFLLETGVKITPGTPTNIVIGDANIIRNISSIVGTKETIIPSHNSVNASFDTSNHSVAVITDLVANRISDGICKITTSNGQSSGNISFTQTATSTDTFSSWVTGTLSSHIYNNILTLINGKISSNSTQKLFTFYSGNVSNPNIIRNLSNFCPINCLYPISVMRDSNNNQYPVVLITQKHIICGHVGGSGSVVFKDSFGTYITRTTTLIGSLTNTDFIYQLNSPITTITPFSLFGDDFINKLNYCIGANKYILPVLYKNWNTGDNIKIAEMYFNGSTSYTLTSSNLMETQFESWASQISAGDSNGPVFTIINNIPVLLGCLDTAQGSITYGGFYKSAIDNILSGSGYSATYIDLSSFPNI